MAINPNMSRINEQEQLRRRKEEEEMRRRRAEAEAAHRPANPAGSGMGTAGTTRATTTTTTGRGASASAGSSNSAGQGQKTWWQEAIETGRNNLTKNVSTTSSGMKKLLEAGKTAQAAGTDSRKQYDEYINRLTKGSTDPLTVGANWNSQKQISRTQQEPITTYEEPAAAEEKKTTFAPMGKTNAFYYDPMEIPKNTYGQDKREGNGARTALLDPGLAFDQERVKRITESLSPLAYRNQMAYSEQWRNTGLWDGVPGTENWRKSDKQLAAESAVYGRHIDDINSRLAGADAASITMPTGFAMPEGEKYGSDQEYMDDRVRGFADRWRRDGIVQLPGRYGMYAPYTREDLETEEGREELAESMYRYFFGEDAAEEALAANGGVLSQETRNEMMGLLTQVDSLSQEERKDLEFQRDVYKAQKDEIDQQIKRYNEYGELLQTGRDFITENGAEGGYSADVDAWEAGTPGGIFDFRSGDKAAQIYSMFGEDTNQYKKIIGNIMSGDEELMNEAAEAFDHAIFYLPEDVEIFQAYMNAGDREGALAFHQGLVDSGILNYRYMTYKKGMWTYQSDRAPIVTGAASVVTQQLTPLEGIGNVIGNMVGDKTAADPNSWHNMNTAFTQAIRGNIAGNAQAEIYGLTGSEVAGKMAGQAAYGLFSAADNVAQFAIGKGLANKLLKAGLIAEGAWQGTAQAASLAQMYGTVFQNSYLKALEDTDGDANYAMATGTLDGAIEIAFETVLGADVPFMEGMSPARFGLYTYLGELIEEEGGNLTEPIVNSIKDNIAEYLTEGKASGKTQWDRDAIALAKENPEKYSGADGRKQAYMDVLKGFGEDLLWTAFSTAVSTGPQAFGNYAQMGSEYREAGKTIASNEQTMDVAEMAAASENKDTRKRGEKIRKRLEGGKKVSNKEIGALHRTLAMENNERIRDVSARVLNQNVRNFIRETYGDRVDAETQGRLAEIAAKATTEGEKSLSFQERSLLRQYPAARDLVNDMTAEERGEQVDPMKRSSQTMETIEQETRTQTSPLEEETAKLGEMVTTKTQKAIRSLAEYAGKVTEKAKTAVKSAAEKMASPEEIGNVLKRMQAMAEESRASQEGTEAAGGNGETTARPPADVAAHMPEGATDAIRGGGKTVVNGQNRGGMPADVAAHYGESREETLRKTVVYDNDDGETEAGEIVGVKTKVEKAEQPDGTTKGTVVTQYVVRDGNGTERTVDAAGARAADEVTAAAMNYIEISGLDDRTATDLLDVVKSGKLTKDNVEAVLKDARNVMIRGSLGMAFPEQIGYDVETAQALYRKGQAAAAAAEESRKAGAGDTGTNAKGTLPGSRLRPGNGKIDFRNVNPEDLDGDTRKQVDAAAEIARRVGFNLIFENDTKNTNRFGEYDAATGSVVLNIAGMDKDGSGHHLLVAMSHEVTHLLEHNSPEGYRALREFIFKEMRRNGVDLVARVSQKMDNYNYQINKMRENGETLSDVTIDGAVAEVVADACDQVLGNEKLIRKLEGENPSLYKKIKNYVSDFVQRVKEAARGMRESGSIDSVYIRDMDELAKKWGFALEEVQGRAGQNATEAEQEGETTSGSGENAEQKQLSLVELDDGTSIAVEDRNILLEKDPETKMSEFIREYLFSHAGDNAIVKSTHDAVYLGKDLPKEYTNSKYTKDLMRGNRKKLEIKNRMAGTLLDMIRAADNKSGPEKAKHNNGKAAARGVYRFTTKVAFPIVNKAGNTVGYNAYSAQLIVNHSGNGKMELYDVMDIEKDDAVAELLKAKGGAYKSRQPDSNVTGQSIAERNGEGNSSSGKNRQMSLAEMDQAHEDAYNQYDDEEGERLVREAAEAAMPDSKVRDKNGRLKVVYHQTNAVNENGEPFTVFDLSRARTSMDIPGFFFAPEYDQYHEYGDRTYAAYLDIKNPAYDVFDIDTSIDEGGLRKREELIAQGYDGVINTEDGKAFEYVAFYPEQIKSAEAFTEDDDGELIPLSLRFNKQNKDIRFSLAEAERESGYQNENMARASLAEDKNGERVFSLASMDHDKEMYRDMLVSSGILKDDEVEGLFKTIDRAMSIIRKDRAILDMNETYGRDERSFLPVKPNSDQLYQVSLDFSTLCRKRLLQQALQEMIEKKYKTVMSKAERVAMRNALRELQKEGKRIEIACALCYVESARLKSPAQIQKFMNDKRGYIVDYLSKSKKDYKAKIDEAEAAMKENLGYDARTSLKDIKRKNRTHEQAIRAMKRRMYQEYQPTAQEEMIIRAAETMDESMYKTAEGLARLKRDYPIVFDAFTTSVRNATKSKGIEGDTPFYAGDTKSISDELIARMNRENGLRSQSWSDFQTYHILDYMGAIIELSTRGAKMQAYTKVPEYARLMGLTGQMINGSLIPMDYNGRELQYDPKEGMDYETCQKLRDMYPDTFGNICIGIRDDHIRALLASDDIDYVIPYHKSSMDKETRKRMGLKNWSEYESQQNEKPQDYSNTNRKGREYQKKPDFSEWYSYQEARQIADAFEAAGMSAWEASKMAMQEMANRYIELCHERGLQEKFAKFSNEDGYWKLLIDRKMINQKTGKLIEQKAVKPIFDSDVIEDILRNEVQQVRETQPDIDEATDAIMKQWEAGDIQKAARTKEVQDTVRAFDDHMLVQNVVELFRDRNETEADTQLARAAAFSLAEVSEIQEKQAALNALRGEIKEIESSEEYQKALEAGMEGDFEPYNAMLEKTGLPNKKRRLDALQKEIQDWQKEWNDQYDREQQEKKAAAIQKSGLQPEEYRRKAAVKEFGYTTDYREAGYLLPNGKMLNFSGEKGRHYGIRGQDHRAISTIYDAENMTGSEAMVAFMSDGNIRCMPETPGMDIGTTTEPTREQYNAIRNIVNQYGRDGYFAIDLTDAEGQVTGTLEYEGRISADRVLNDLKTFFKTGEIPQQSGLSRFFSLAEEGPSATEWLMALDPNDMDAFVTRKEKAMVRNYQKARNGITETEARIQDMKARLKDAKGDEARKLRINIQTEQNRLARARKQLTDLTGGTEYASVLKQAQQSIDFLMGAKSQEQIRTAADSMRKRADDMRRTAEEAAKSLATMADREQQTVMRRMIDQQALKQNAQELNRYFGLDDQQRMEDGLAAITLKMESGDQTWDRSLEEMATRILNEVYGGSLIYTEGGMRDQEAYSGQLSDIMTQLIQATRRILPGIPGQQSASVQTEIRNLTNYVSTVSDITRQSARGMEKVAQMAEDLKAEATKTEAAAADIRRKLAMAIRYYDTINRQSDAQASADKLEAAIRTIESQAAKRILEEQNKWAHRLENDQNVRRLANENLRTRKKINTAYTRMAKLILNESDQQNVPEHMKPIVRAALRMILDNDAGGNRKITGQDWQSLMRSKQTMDLIDRRDGTGYSLDSLVDFEGLDSGGDDVAVAIEEALKQIEDGIGFWRGGRGRNAVSLEGDKAALEKIQQGMSRIYDIATRSRQVFLEGQLVSAANAAYEVDSEAKKKEVYQEFVGGLGRLLKGLDRNVRLGNMTPEYFFKNLKNNGLTRIYNEFKTAEDMYGRILLEAKRKIAEAAEKNHYSQWDMSQKKTLKLENGKDVSLTLEQLMALRATWKREKTLGPEMSSHLEKGGFIIEQESEKKVIGREARQTNPIRVTAADMAEAEKLLTDEQKAYVDELVRILSQDMGAYGNEASMRMYGIEKYKETYYFPFRVWDGVKNKASNTGGAVNPTNNNRAAHQSFTNRRKANASNAVLIRDFTETCAEHINQMATYATFGTSIENMNRVLNFRVTENAGDPANVTERNVETILRERYGENAINYLRDFMKDLNGGAVQQNSGLAQSLMSMFKKNAVGGSLSVAMQQPLSYIRASTMIDTKYLAGALNPKYYRGSYNEMLQHSGVAVIKDMGKFDMNFSRGATEWLAPEAREASRARAAYNKVEDVTNALPEKMDQMTWTRMWSAIKIEQHEAHPGMDMSSDEFLDMVGKRFNDVMRRTQVYDSVLVKSQLMRKQDWVSKSITAFRAEPTLSLNMIMDALINRKEAGGKKNAAAVAATFLLSAIAQAAVKGIMSAGRSPDEKKTLAENFAYRFAGSFISEANPLGLIPGYDNIVDAFSGNDINDNAWGMLTTFGKTISKIWNPPAGDNLTPESGWRYVEDTAGQIAQMFTGVPAKNLMRDSRAVYNWFLSDNYASRNRKGTDEQGNETVIPERGNSGAVMKYQMIDQLSSSDLMAVLDKTLGISLWDSSNTAYMNRIYEAEKAGRTEEAAALREYMTAGKGKTEKSIDSAVASAAKKDEDTDTMETAEFLLEGGYADKTTWITQQYKEGNLTDEELRELYRKYFPDKDPKGTIWEAAKEKYLDGDITRKQAEDVYKKTYPDANADDVWQAFDIIDYKNETGKTASGAYYRLHDAIEENSSEAISKAVNTLMEHGKKKNGFKSSIETKWKDTYIGMQNGSAEKVKLRDGITKAMKAAGHTAKEIDKMFANWTKK